MNTYDFLIPAVKDMVKGKDGRKIILDLLKEIKKRDIHFSYYKYLKRIGEKNTYIIKVEEPGRLIGYMNCKKTYSRKEAFFVAECMRKQFPHVIYTIERI